MATEIPNQIHTNKYYLPDALDNGVTFAEIIEDFMTRMANHNHSGTDSAPISLNITKLIQEFVSGVNITWSSLGGGVYRSVIPLDLTSYENNIRFFYTKVDGEWLAFVPETEKIDASTYYVFSNQPLQDLKVVSM
jgi:hypothetical protein